MYQNFDKVIEKAEKAALVPLLIVDFRRTYYPLPWVVERRLCGDFVEFPAPRHSLLCGIKTATRCVRELAQVAERGDEEVYRDLSEW
jgi:hypothetical protein